MFSSCQIVHTHRLKHLYFILWIKLLNHVACHVSLRHEMGNKCSGFTNYQSNYQKGEGRVTETAGRIITPVSWSTSYLKRTQAKEDSSRRFLDITCGV